MSAATIAKAISIADRSVIADIETEGVCVGERSNRCYDVRALLDPREQPAETIDMFKEAIDYAVRRGLVEIDAARPGVVRIRKRPASARAAHAAG